MKKQCLIFNLGQAQKKARMLAKALLRAILTNKEAVVIGLIGDLGTGKTTFIQGFVEGLGIKEKVLSPTFVLIKKYTGATRVFYHIDCYRIENSKEILGLGFKEIISEPKNIIAIEWADRIKKIMPKNTIWIRFDFMDGAKRKIVVE